MCLSRHIRLQSECKKKRKIFSVTGKKLNHHGVINEKAKEMCLLLMGMARCALGGNYEEISYYTCCLLNLK